MSGIFASYRTPVLPNLKATAVLQQAAQAQRDSVSMLTRPMFESALKQKTWVQHEKMRVSTTPVIQSFLKQWLDKRPYEARGMSTTPVIQSFLKQATHDQRGALGVSSTSVIQSFLKQATQGQRDSLKVSATLTGELMVRAHHYKEGAERALASAHVTASIAPELVAVAVDLFDHEAGPAARQVIDTDDPALGHALDVSAEKSELREWLSDQDVQWFLAVLVFVMFLWANFKIGQVAPGQTTANVFADVKLGVMEGVPAAFSTKTALKWYTNKAPKD